jgi:diguanylate cyclase (GGDEF)-like protein
VLDSGGDDVHSALVPPGALHQRVTAALANWQLDDAEELLADVERDPTPFDAPETEGPADLGRAWADTLRAELLVRRLRVAGFTLVGDPLGPASEAAPAPLDLHAGVAELIEGSSGETAAQREEDPRAESASRAALAIALVRSAKAAFDATDDDLQRAAGLARHARIELLSRRIDAAMDEAVEAASLLDPSLPPSELLVDTLSTLAGVLADLELMPLALDYQRRAHETAVATAALTPDDGDLAVLVAAHATRLGELCAELGEGLLDDGAPESAAPHFAEARRMAERALELLPPGQPGVVYAQVVHGWALVGLSEHTAAAGPLRAAVRITSATADRALLSSAQLALGRALRRQGDGRGADEHLTQALTLSTEHGLPRVRRAALRELCTLHSELDDAGRALPYLQAYISDELDRVDERRTRWVELFGRRKSLLETERAAGQLRRQAYEDPLTHLPNRRYAEARLDGLLSAGSAPALAVVDVDRFKSINDAIGHPGGDAVLRVVAELLVDGVRDTDEVCRWAGDEFVILLPDTTAEQAERALERIRTAIATYDWSEIGLRTRVTISVGIASAARGDDRRTLFAAADGVLYDAKRNGRDRVVRLSAVTQTRAGASPLDALFGPPPAAESAGEPAAPASEPTEPTEPDDDGFGPLFAAGPVDPPLGLGGPTDPPLGPLPKARPASPPADLEGPTATEPELVRGAGLTTDEVLARVRAARQQRPDRPVVVLGASSDALVALAAEHDAYTTMDAAARAAAVGPAGEPSGRVAVLGDGAVAAETAFVARIAGAEVVGAEDADVVVVVPGLDATLPARIAAGTRAPVVVVPTSSGQTGGFAGVGALLTMLSTPTPGVVVSSLDDGWSAGLFAARMARRATR